jgi:predicted MPP superfamily phosphohydrolase
VKKVLKTHKILILFAVIIGIAFFCVWQNNSIVITKSDYVNVNIPSDFDGFTIAHISDLHNKNFGENQIKLLNKVQAVSPDIIVITGDLIDRRKYDLDTAMTFMKGAIDIAPVYYVSGNHEAWSGKFSLIKESLIGVGVCVLDNAEVKISKGDAWINILGVSDPDFLTSSYIDGTNVSEMLEQLNQWSVDENFKILLSHRPELFDLYCDSGMDLIFSGHAHGGQIRIPFVGGLVAPDQGLLPKFTSGSYHNNSSTMFVSRGLGNSVFPIRIFNRPEIVVVTLKSKS